MQDIKLDISIFCPIITLFHYYTRLIDTKLYKFWTFVLHENLCIFCSDYWRVMLDNWEEGYFHMYVFCSINLFWNWLFLRPLRNECMSTGLN